MSPRRCLRCQKVYEGEARFCPTDGSPLVEVAGGAAQKKPKSGSGGADKTAVRAAVVRPPEGPSYSSAATMVGQVMDRRYQIMRRLGEGGMSFVYEGRDIANQESVAIKVLSPKLAQDRNAVERLRREAGLAMRLNHPNACPITRFGETEDGLIYLVMPYLRGELLSDREARDGPMPLETSLPFIVQMCEGLHHAHGLHIIHRDLKPENVMIVKENDGEERAVVMDFGLAKDNSAGPGAQKLTATGIVLGTPEFMSPEQVRGHQLDPRSDVYALAIGAFEMLTGKLPFAGRSPQEMMISRLRGKPVPLRQYRPELSAELEKVLIKAMDLDPKNRYDTIMEFSDAVRVSVGGGPGGDDDEAGGFFSRLKRTLS